MNTESREDSENSVSKNWGHMDCITANLFLIQGYHSGGLSAI
jgi:hypothetical protein